MLDDAGESALSRQLEAARNLALFGAETIARERCASMFLDDLHLFQSHPGLRSRFVECLLLLRMPNLLARLLRATDGVTVRITVLGSEAPARHILSFSNGFNLVIPQPAPDAGAAVRAEHAALWSERILQEAAKSAVGGGAALDADAPSAGAQDGPETDRVRRGDLVLTVLG